MAWTRVQMLEVKTLLWRIARSVMTEKSLRELREQLYGPKQPRKRTSLRLVRGQKGGA